MFSARCTLMLFDPNPRLYGFSNVRNSCVSWSILQNSKIRRSALAIQRRCEVCAGMDGFPAILPDSGGWNSSCGVQGEERSDRQRTWHPSCSRRFVRYYCVYRTGSIRRHGPKFVRSSVRKPVRTSCSVRNFVRNFVRNLSVRELYSRYSLASWTSWGGLIGPAKSG